jgi:hypothetical protein
VRPFITVEMPDSVTVTHGNYILARMRRDFGDIDVSRAPDAGFCRLYAYVIGIDLPSLALSISLAHAEGSWQREHPPNDEPDLPVASVLQVVLQRIDRVTFPHGPKHHVAIEFHGGDGPTFVADLMHACVSLAEARSMFNDLRDTRELGDETETVLYFPRTTWVAS